VYPRWSADRAVDGQGAIDAGHTVGKTGQSATRRRDCAAMPIIDDIQQKYTIRDTRRD
jgi:hypothetical protein